jgi:hypothetical protein
MLGAMAFYLPLMIVVFLAILDGFLNGAMKQRIDAVLGSLLVAIIILGFYLFGWGMGLANILACFVWGAGMRPLARRSAAFLLAYPPKR